MAKVVLDVPTLWADHHVLKVRDALLSLKGVEDAYVSSAWKQVLVTFNDSEAKAEDIENALAQAGYPVGEGEVPVLAQPTKNRKDPSWQEAMRTTLTNEVDREMSGEFRRY